MSRETQTVRCAVDGGLAVLRMCGDHGNAIDDDLLDDLLRSYSEMAADDAVRGVVLTSSKKVFCPGLDLLVLREYERPEMDRFMARLTDCVLAMYTFPKPVVAAISGHALAGGCILALTADRRVLRWGALVGLNEIRVGVPLPFGIANLVREAVRPHYLEEVALVGRNYTDEHAVATGLVHEVQQAQGFEERCCAWLEDYASKDLQAFAATKRYLRSSVAERIAGESAEHRGEFLDCWFSSPTQRRIGEIVNELRSRRK